VVDAKAAAALRGRERSSMEGVPVSPKRPSLTRRRWMRCLAVDADRVGRKAVLVGFARDRGRQRRRRTLGCRQRTPQSGGAARRSIRSKLRQYRAVLRRPSRTGSPGRGGTAGLRRSRSWRFAVKRSFTWGLTEGFLAGGGLASVLGSRSARIARRRSGRARESGSSRGARIVVRLQKSVRGIFFGVVRERDATGQPVAGRPQTIRDSSTRPAGP